MKKLISLFLVLLMVISLSACKNDTPKDDNSDNEGDQIVIEKVEEKPITYTTGKATSRTLVNTYKCLTEGEKLNVAYIGGSVTNGYGGTKPWRALTTAWLKEKFPEAQINETNAGRGGTSSLWGLARLEKDVLSKNPDLVFVEFAINDSYAGLSEMQSAAFMDGIIRNINKNNPKTDIVIVFVTDNSKRDSEYANVKGHRTVAEYYGIPCIDVGKQIIEEINTTGNGWDHYFGDSVHPNDNGYKAYADEVIRVMSVLLQDAKKETAAKPHNIGDKPATSNTPSEIKKVEVNTLDGGDTWRYRTPPKASIGNEGELVPKNTGAKLTYEFEGDTIGCVFSAKKNGNIKVMVDGKSEKIFNQGADTAGCLERIFYNGLENGKHTLTIEYTGSGYFALSYLLVG